MGRVVTEKTHAPDGSKTMSELHREEVRWRETQPMTTSCSVYGCDWTHEGTVAEGRDAFLEHRAAAHPTVDGIERREAQRQGVTDKELFVARAAERRQQLALRALDDGEPQSEVVGREPQAEEASAARPPGADARSLEHTPPSPGPGPAAAEPGSRPRTKSWTNDEIVDAIRSWSESHDGQPPKTDEWRKSSDAHPTQSTVVRRFGSWHAAIEAAALTARRRGGQRATPEEPEQTLTVGAARPLPGSSDADLVLVVGAAIEQAEGVGPALVERLIGEAERLERRASALRQIAQGVTAYEATEVRAA